MDEQKINELGVLTSLGTGDLFPVGDASASNVMKQITRENLITDLGIKSASDAQTLTNKTIDADNNTISNIGDEELKAGINANKIADASVSNTEFQYLNGVTSAIQTQLGAKQPLDAQLTSIAGLTPGIEGKMITSDGLGDYQISTVGDVRGYLNVEDGADVTDEANVTDALDGATLTDLGTPASGDKILLQDASDSDNLKVALFSEFGGGGGYTNLTEFVDQTAWRLFYSNTSGDVTELALGADGTFLKSNGATSAPTFAVPAGSGDVSKVGTPADNQVGVWTGDGTIEGTSGLTYDGSNFQLTGDIGATGSRITKGWFTDLQVTNAIAGDITGNSATVTSFTPASGSLTLSGADALTLTTTASTDVTLPTTGTLLANVSEDATPQLGGELDCQANSVGFTQQTGTGDGTTTINWGNGNKYQFTFGAFNETFTFTAPAKPGNFLLKMIQDGTGSRTATFPASVKWSGGTAPTLTTDASAVDIVSFYYDGTNYYGVASLDFS